jgi:hypothetical protein
MTVRQAVSRQTVSIGGVHKIYGRAVGAATSNMTGLEGPGIASIVRGGVGIHTITLNEKYQGLLMAAFNVIDTGTIDDWEVTLDTDLTSGNTFVINVFKGGTAADLPTTTVLLMELTMNNSSVKPQVA